LSSNALNTAKDWRAIAGVYADIIEAIQALSEQLDGKPEHDGRLVDLETNKIYHIPHFRPMS